MVVYVCMYQLLPLVITITTTTDVNVQTNKVTKLQTSCAETNKQTNKTTISDVSDKAKIPAEFKHITKQRKRN